jgi:hypothetical protein
VPVVAVEVPEVSKKMSAAIFPPAIRGFVPSWGTLRRCKHSVYIGVDDPGPEAPYCSGCTPQGPYNQRPVELPSSHGRLNTGRAQRGACPKCFSACHYAHGTVWICADCHAQFPAPRGIIESQEAENE